MGDPQKVEGDRVLRYPTAPLSIGLTLGLAIGLLVASVVAFPAGPAQSREPDRTLKLFFGHTGERGEFTFKRNGRYDRSALNRINQFLRDWRKDEPTRMDPQLLDLVWSIYKASGSRDYVHVISAYRSPATNKLLRTRSSGVAKNSQHMLGKAMDFYIPDVSLAKLRGIAMKAQGGGVGYYPRSGSPFVHVDTGNVRAWPRMSRQQLIALFPNGNTVHLPADGKPLPGYELAVARRHTTGTTTLAYLDTGSTESEETDRTGTAGSASGWLRRVFPGEGQEEDDVATAAPAQAPATGEPQLLTAALEDDSAPRPPRARPASAMETPVADLGAATIVAAADAEAMESLVVPPLPRTRPDPTILADSLRHFDDAASLEVGAEDAIAALTTRVDQELPTPAAADPARPVELAFAALPELPPEPSPADRAILAAFAALDEPGAIRNADATLTAAVTRRANDASPPQQPSPALALAYAGSDLLSSALVQPAAAETVVASGPGIVLAPIDLASYDGDEPALVDLIVSPEGSDPGVGQLAMPKPASELYVAPEGASEVADLRGRSGPPVDRYALGRSDGMPSEQGFFSKLFASLIE